MRPFFKYFGSKWNLARHLGPPQHDHVIEPFAGSAGYSCYWEPEQVTLIDKDPVIIGIWQFLQHSSARNIMALPLNFDSVDDLHICQEAKWLIGFWLNINLSKPMKRHSNWARASNARPICGSYWWGPLTRIRLSRQVDHIRHWTIIEGDWWQARDVEAHWHVDPPYLSTGRQYPYNTLDYGSLAEWCRQRHGFVQVCEAEDANWMDFRLYHTFNNHRTDNRKRYREVLYQQGEERLNLFTH